VRKRILFGLAVLAAVVVIAAAAGAWLLSSLLLDPHHDLVKENIRVEKIEPGSVVLASTTASRRPGVYGLDATNGHAIIGRVLTDDGHTVARTLLSVSGRIVAGDRVAVDPDVWMGNPRSALDIPFQLVKAPDPLGPMPAWQIAGRGATWVIFVHGIDGSRIGGLRPLATLHQLRFPTLLISYRNDLGAPPSTDHLIHLGMTEWQDLDAAARYAVSRGARRLVLYGDSMGGAIVTRFMHKSALAPRVVALVLDAPVLDWKGVVGHQASRFGPSFLADPVEWWIAARIDVSWSALDEIRQARSFHIPILLFQGAADPLVPPAESRAFAADVPGGLVTYVQVPDAGHIQSWNVDPSSYDRHLRAFLSRWSG
jgi:pimeloyl-ACP methyl ester carboxylesterase